jgi:hypothetical protein
VAFRHRIRKVGDDATTHAVQRFAQYRRARDAVNVKVAEYCHGFARAGGGGQTRQGFIYAGQ